MAAARYRLLTAVAAAAVWSASAAAEPPRWRLDPHHTFVHFEVLHFGTSTLRGRFGPLAGEVELDPAAGRGRIGLVIPMASVSTGLPVLDRRLCDPDLLDCTGHPQAWFVAERFRFDEQGRPAEVRGELTLRGVGHAVSLRMTRHGCHDDPATRRRVCGGDYEAELQRSTFGVDWGVPFVSDRVRLKVQVEAFAP